VVAHGVMIDCASSIEIGPNCQLGPATLVSDLPQDTGRSRNTGPGSDGSVALATPFKIGHHVTIAANCTIAAEIGERTTIGPNSAVTKPLPADCVASGVPASVLEFHGVETAPPARTSGRNR
jgi:acetyltransferase-like isoleucine patch superfamily enzyme